jgi:hypothetical protein
MADRPSMHLRLGPVLDRTTIRPDVHVTPIDDLREHEETRACWCGPRVEQEPEASAVVVHHAADGRELVEEHGIN